MWFECVRIKRKLSIFSIYLLINWLLYKHSYLRSCCYNPKRRKQPQVSQTAINVATPSLCVTTRPQMSQYCAQMSQHKYYIFFTERPLMSQKNWKTSLNVTTFKSFKCYLRTPRHERQGPCPALNSSCVYYYYCHNNSQLNRGSFSFVP